MARTQERSTRLPALSDDQLLLEIQRRAVLFFWERAHPITGLVNDRANNFGADRYTISSCAATGFGLAALPIGIEHGWLGRKDALNRAETTLRFLLSMPQVHGWMPHFISNDNGARVDNSEYSSIDTALLVAGALVCVQYFAADPVAAEITALGNELYQRLDWPWILTNNQTEPAKRIVSHGWRPETGFLSYNYGSYSEAILLYLLCLGVLRDPLAAEIWAAIDRPLQHYRGLESLAGGPIFIHQMPHCFFPLQNRRDELGFDYWASSTQAMQIHRQFCRDHAAESLTYTAGFWGLNASDGPNGYTAYGAPNGPTDGTVSPTGAISSIMFVPALGISAARDFYTILGDRLWGRYGFANACNLDREWYDTDVIGIDLGMVLLAIENYRTGLVWSLLQGAKPVRSAFRKAHLRRTREPEPRPVFRR